MSTLHRKNSTYIIALTNTESAERQQFIKFEVCSTCISGKQMCEECYSDNDRITPLLNPCDCLCSHTQYICGTCGRCICIENAPQRGAQRWMFPFKSLEIAKLYLRTADFTTKKSCGIYEIKNKNGRKSYKIFASNEDLKLFLKKNKDKKCPTMDFSFKAGDYKEYPHTQIRKLSREEAELYLLEQSKNKSDL